MCSTPWIRLVAFLLNVQETLSTALRTSSLSTFVTKGRLRWRLLFAREPDSWQSSSVILLPLSFSGVFDWVSLIPCGMLGAVSEMSYRTVPDWTIMAGDGVITQLLSRSFVPSYKDWLTMAWCTLSGCCSHVLFGLSSHILFGHYIKYARLFGLRARSKGLRTHFTSFAEMFTFVGKSGSRTRWHVY